MKLTPPVYTVRFNYQENTQPTKGKFHLLAYQETTYLPEPKEWKEPLTTVCAQILWTHEPDRIQIIKIEDIEPDQLCQKCSKAFVISGNSDKQDLRLQSILEEARAKDELEYIDWVKVEK